ncbi:MAG: hypothetical protein ACI9EF_000850 [Pseudohongiellaceae bacterium]|jgi:hypothetical protein
MILGSASMTLMARWMCLLGALFLATNPGDGPEELAELALADIKRGVKEFRPEAIEEGLRDLESVYLKVSEKTMKKIGKSVTSVFKMKPKKPDQGGADPREALVEAYMLAVGLIYDKPAGQGLLHAAHKQRHIADWWEVRAALVEALGYAKDEGEMSFFAKELDVDNHLVVAAAASAMAQYAEEPVPLRRRAVSAILKSWESYAVEAEKEVSRKKDSTAARDRLANVEGPFGEALRELTRQDFEGVESWADWFTQHGDENNW